MNGRSILVADAAQADERLRALFAGAELRFVRTLQEAERALAQKSCDLLVIGVHFDDSRMFDLLRAVRADRRHAAIRIACVRAFGVPIGTLGLEVAVKALEADAFIDLTVMPEEAARSALRALL